MKKLEFANIVCEVSVTENYKMFSEVTCEYEKDTVAYAVERFFCRSSRFRRECTLESWQIRTTKGRERIHKFSYLIPSVLLELPGNWTRLTGEINAAGVKVWKVELLLEHPCFQKAMPRKVG